MGASPDRGGGDPACWVDRVCALCGRIPDDGEVDAGGRCLACAAASETGPAER